MLKWKVTIVDVIKLINLQKQYKIIQILLISVFWGKKCEWIFFYSLIIHIYRPDQYLKNVDLYGPQSVIKSWAQKGGKC
jgi:hypothetical protein